MKKPGLTRKQIAAIKYLIANSPDANNLGKRLLWWMIDKSKRFTQEVAIEIPKTNQNDKQIRGAIVGIHHILSCHGLTHLNEVLTAAGAGLHFCEGISDKWAYAYLSTVSYILKPSTKIMRPHVSAIEKIRLAHPGLYPGIENNTEPPDLIN